MIRARACKRVNLACCHKNDAQSELAQEPRFSRSESSFCVFFWGLGSEHAVPTRAPDWRRVRRRSRIPNASRARFSPFEGAGTGLLGKAISTCHHPRGARWTLVLGGERAATRWTLGLQCHRRSRRGQARRSAASGMHPDSDRELRVFGRRHRHPGLQPERHLRHVSLRDRRHSRKRRHRRGRERRRWQGRRWRQGQELSGCAQLLT
jgi:hypothetical protein